MQTRPRKWLNWLYGVIRIPFVLLFRILTFPFRVLRWIINFFTLETPSEPSLNETFTALEEDENYRDSLLDHVAALRGHVLRSVFVFLVFCLLSFLYVDNILNFLQAPLNQITDLGLRVSGPGNIFDIIPQVVFSSAFLLTIPYFIFEFFIFAVPGLGGRERLVALVLQFIFLMFSISSLAVGYYLILPSSLSAAVALTNHFGVYDWELFGYLSFTSKILILSAIIVYYPFFIFLFVILYKKPRIPLRVIVLISFALSAIITPGTMILIDFGLTIMLSIIYIPTYLAIMLLYRAPRGTGMENQPTG